MKRTIIAVSVTAAMVSTGVQADSLSHWKTQDRFNLHIQGQTTDQQRQLDHLERSENNQNKWLDRIQTNVTSNTERLAGHDGHLDRIEGVLNSNRIGNEDRQRQIDDAHARIGGVTEQADIDRQASVERDSQLSGDIAGVNDRTDRLEARSDNAEVERARLDGRVSDNTDQIEVTDARTIENAGAITAGQKRTEEVNNQSIRRDEQLSGRLDQQSSRADALGAESERIETESLSRDNALAGRIDRADAERSDLYSTVDTVDRNSRSRDAQLEQHVRDIDQWNIDQFNRHAGAIKDVRGDVAQVRQDLASERHERKEQGKDLSAGVAGALAAAAAQFDPSYYGTQVSVSGGAYRGENAVGLSIGARASESVFINGGVVHDSRGHQGYNVGANFKF